MKGKILEFIKEYLPDVIIIIGVLVLSYNILRPPEVFNPLTITLGYTDYHIKEKIWGIFLIVVGIDIVIRKYLSSKNERKD